jgi:hypothetical protein
VQLLDDIVSINQNNIVFYEKELEEHLAIKSWDQSFVVIERPLQLHD